MRTLFLRLHSENGPPFLCPVIIRVTYRSTEHFAGQASKVEPLFKDTRLIQTLYLLSLVEIDPSRFPGGYSIYPWVGRCGAAPHTLTLFQTNIADFPTLLKTEFRFLIPCLSQRKSILINVRACKNFAVYRLRKDILFKTKIDKSIPLLRQKMINSIPCLRQKSRRTYPGWPHVPIKPL